MENRIIPNLDGWIVISHMKIATITKIMLKKIPVEKCHPETNAGIPKKVMNPGP
jgi:hypothetical protein